MQVAQFLVQHAAVHFGVPMVDPRQHPKHGGRTHHKVEVGHYKVGIVQIDIQGRIAQVNTGQTP